MTPHVLASLPGDPPAPVMESLPGCISRHEPLDGFLELKVLQLSLDPELPCLKALDSHPIQYSNHEHTAGPELRDGIMNATMSVSLTMIPMIMIMIMTHLLMFASAVVPSIIPYCRLKAVGFSF